MQWIVVCLQLRLDRLQKPFHVHMAQPKDQGVSPPDALYCKSLAQKKQWIDWYVCMRACMYMCAVYMCCVREGDREKVLLHHIQAMV